MNSRESWYVILNSKLLHTIILSNINIAFPFWIMYIIRFIITNIQ